MNEYFINEIVNEVMKRLQETIGQESTSKNYSCNLTKERRVCVVGEIPRSNYDSTGLTYYSIDEEYVDGDDLLITTLSPFLLANLAIGLATNQVEELLLNNLLNGKRVYILEDALLYQRYRRTAFKAIYLLYQDYEKKLRNYGLEFIKEPVDLLRMNTNTMEEDGVSCKLQYQNETNHIGKYSKDDVTNTTIGVVDWRKRHVVLEKDFMNSRIDYNRKVILNHDCIITPMARDYIREHQIHIERG